MKKYVIQTCTIGADGKRTMPAFLEPYVHTALYEIPPIRRAVEFLRDVPQTEGIWIRIDTRAYAITVYEGDRPDYDKYAFKLEERTDGENTSGRVLGEEDQGE